MKKYIFLLLLLFVTHKSSAQEEGALEDPESIQELDMGNFRNDEELAKKIMASIDNYKNLEYLDLNGGPIYNKAFFEKLSSLINLKSLTMGAYMSWEPEVVEPLKELKQIEELDILMSTSDTYFPDFIYHMTNLKSLTISAINNNGKIRPVKIGNLDCRISNLKNLEELRLHIRFDEIPSCVFTLPNLNSFSLLTYSLHKNSFSEISTSNIEHLHFANSNIAEHMGGFKNHDQHDENSFSSDYFFKQLHKMKHLTSLYFEGYIQDGFNFENLEGLLSLKDISIQFVILSNDYSETIDFTDSRFKEFEKEILSSLLKLKKIESIELTSPELNEKLEQKFDLRYELYSELEDILYEINNTDNEIELKKLIQEKESLKKKIKNFSFLN